MPRTPSSLDPTSSSSPTMPMRSAVEPATDDEAHAPAASIGACSPATGGGARSSGGGVRSVKRRRRGWATGEEGK
jgi:hypothetical protein